MTLHDKNHSGSGALPDGGKIPYCDQYRFGDFLRYLNATMSQDELALFEEHSAQCRACRQGVQQEHARMLAELDVRQNDRFLQKAMQKLDDLAAAEPVNLMELIVGFIHGGLAVIRTTAEQLSEEPAYGTSRSKAAISSRQQLRIVQEFKSPPLSIQVTCDAEAEKEKVRLSLSVFDRQQDDFLRNYEAILISKEGEQRVASNPEGEIFFSVLPAASYDIGLVQDTEHLATVTIAFGVAA